MKSKKGKALAYSARLIGIRPRSEKELKERLSKRHFDGADIESAILFLKEKKMLDDSKFARLWIESRMNRNPKGGMLLTRELKAKGVPSAIIEKAILEADIDEARLAKELAAKALASMKAPAEEKAKKKLFGLLARRGFSFDVIEEVIHELVDAK